VETHVSGWVTSHVGGYRRRLEAPQLSRTPDLKQICGLLRLTNFGLAPEWRSVNMVWRCEIMGAENFSLRSPYIRRQTTCNQVALPRRACTTSLAPPHLHCHPSLSFTVEEATKVLVTWYLLDIPVQIRYWILGQQTCPSTWDLEVGS